MEEKSWSQWNYWEFCFGIYSSLFLSSGPNYRSVYHFDQSFSFFFSFWGISQIKIQNVCHKGPFSRPKEEKEPGRRFSGRSLHQTINWVCMGWRNAIHEWQAAFCQNDISAYKVHSSNWRWASALYGFGSCSSKYSGQILLAGLGFDSSGTSEPEIWGQNTYSCKRRLPSFTTLSY